MSTQKLCALCAPLVDGSAARDGRKLTVIEPDKNIGASMVGDILNAVADFSGRSQRDIRPQIAVLDGETILLYFQDFLFDSC